MGQNVRNFANTIIPQLQKRLRNCVSRLRHCKKARKRKMLESTIQALVTEIINNEYQMYRSRSLRGRFESLYEMTMYKHAGKLCQIFCEEMHVKLPRELRDVIYGYISGDQKVFVASRSAKPTGYCPMLPAVEQIMDLPEMTLFIELQIWNMAPFHHPAYTGITVFEEYIQVWYRQSTFIFPNVFFVSEFLAVNPWRLQITPKDFVRRVV